MDAPSAFWIGPNQEEGMRRVVVLPMNSRFFLEGYMFVHEGRPDMDHFSNLGFWPNLFSYLKIRSVPSESLIGRLNACTIGGGGNLPFAQTRILGLFWY